MRQLQVVGLSLAIGLLAAFGGARLVSPPHSMLVAAITTPHPYPLPHGGRDTGTSLWGNEAPRAIQRPAFPAVTAAAGVLIDADTGRVLWSLSRDQPRHIASLTKIFTAMEALSLVPNLDEEVTVPQSITDLPWDSTLMGLTIGERVSIRDLLYGMFLPSGNDAAVTLADGLIAEPQFIAGMNRIAAQIGMRETHFTNPWGADDPGHYASAMDLAMAAEYLDTHYPTLAAIADTTTMEIPATVTHKAFHLQTLNHLVTGYPGATGLKTGWTGQAGGCLVGTAVRYGHPLVSVVLGSNNATLDSRALLDYGFALEELSTQS
jgi:D-alanyl-D-alanine carboxypeptidase